MKNFAATVMIASFVMLFITTHAFLLQQPPHARRLTCKLSAVKSYREQLQEARRGKQAGAQSAPSVSPTCSSGKGAPSTKQAAQIPNISRDLSPASDVLPFTDELYDHMIYVIGKITSKIKSHQSLSPDELARFRESVAIIITDATGEQDDSPIDSSAPASGIPDSVEEAYGPSESSEVQDADGNAFTEFAGWKLENMDKMTTEEYYESLNKRLAKIKTERKRAGTYDPRSTDSYFASLSGPKKPQP